MSNKINVILTSFEQFYKYKYNPTISVSEKVENILKNSNIINLSTQVMQCKYSTIKQEVYGLYESNPDIILSLGLGASRTSLNLESLAQNEYSSVAPDNEGIILNGDPIIPNGNDLLSSLNLNDLEILSNKHVKSAISIGETVSISTREQKLIKVRTSISHNYSISIETGTIIMTPSLLISITVRVSEYLSNISSGSEFWNN